MEDDDKTQPAADPKDASMPQPDPWTLLRGALKETFERLGGGEAYLRNERDNFYPPGRDL
jgi:hypothetical protein